jgi:Fe-S cluster assembly protein SufD
MALAFTSCLAEWERTRDGRARLPDTVERLREAARDHFAARGFPTTRDEEWRFTSVTPIVDRAFRLAGPAPAGAALDGLGGLDGLRLSGLDRVELVFVDGRYAPALSETGALPRGVRVESLARALAQGAGDLTPHLAQVAPIDHRAFTALNTAFLDDGVWIDVAAGIVLDRPIHVVFVATDPADGQWTMVHPRVLVVVGDNAKASLVETYAGLSGGRYFTNAVTEIVLGENAVLDHCKLQYESVEASHVGAIHVRAGRSAVCTLHSISAGGALVRNDVVARLEAEGVDCTLDGLYLADGRRLVDNHTTIDHARPHCGSREIYKGILADRAQGVFNGRIVVRPDAQRTDARQTNRVLLLSEDAAIHTQPQLEIFANDVKCTHGAAIGQVDEEALFYLRSRGLDAARARQLLIHAFAAEVLNRLPLEAVRADVEDRLSRQLARVLPAA